MQRKLCFTIDDEKYTRLLVLEEKEAEELDEFISSNFKNSKAMELKYSKQIKEYIEAVGKMYPNLDKECIEKNGGIVLLENNGKTDIELEIVDKSCLEVVKRLLKDPMFVIDFALEQQITKYRENGKKNHISDNFLMEARYTSKKTNSETLNRYYSELNIWFKIMQEKANFYEIIREIYTYAKKTRFPLVLQILSAIDGNIRVTKAVSTPITIIKPYDGEFDNQGLTTEEIEMLKDPDLRCLYKQILPDERELSYDIMERIEGKNIDDEPHVR